MTRYVLLGVLAFPAGAFAQVRPCAPYPAPQDRARISINAGVHSFATGFTSTTATPTYLELATVNTSYNVPAGLFVDGGAIIRIGRRGFAVGATVSSFTRSDTASLTATIPHPFVFNTPRALSGTTSPLERRETAVHMQAAFVSTSKRRDIVIAAGPSFFNVSQDLVSGVTYTEAYPYDTVTFSAATVSKASASMLGFNASVDVGFKLSQRVGIGGVVRFTRARAHLPLANTTSAVDVDGGGVQVGGGLRFYF